MQEENDWPLGVLVPVLRQVDLIFVGDPIDGNASVEETGVGVVRESADTWNRCEQEKGSDEPTGSPMRNHCRKNIAKRWRS